MPIYEFVCHDCGSEFERIQSFSDESVPACDTCQSVDVKRRVGRPAIHFKGSGWYITDSKSKGKGKQSASGASDSSKEDSKGESSATETTKETTEKSEKPAAKEKVQTAEKSES